VIWKDAEWLAFFPETPATPGHTLVVPRQHVPHYWALDEELAATLAAASLRIGRAIHEVQHPAGMNLITSEGAAAEQTVMHVHLHLVPRWEHDAVDAIWPPKQAADSAVVRHLADKLRATLGSAI
jgi:histidine triad (HIT) family protein